MPDETPFYSYRVLLLCCFAFCGCSDSGEVSETPESLPSNSDQTGWNPLSLPPAPFPKKPRHPRQDDWFEDVTERSGIKFAYQNGREGKQYTILETVGGGVAMLDYDGDGDLDLFFTRGGRISEMPPMVVGLPSALYRNDGNWKFVDVTTSAGLDKPGDYSHGAFVSDYDRDGSPDLFVTCYGRSRLYHNEGNGIFLDVTESSGLVVDGWSTAAAWADVDRDGWPDLYVAGYLKWQPGQSEYCGNVSRNLRDVCPPQHYPAAPDRLFRNRGNGTFEEITKQAGLNDSGKALGVLAADFNEDGWIDFYVANDVVPNDLYLGAPGLRFEEVGKVSATAYNEYGAPEGSMGVDFADYDGDGRGDLWVTNFELEDNSLYRNLGQGAFSHVTVVTGLGGRCRPLVGFGTGFADFDSDGWPDLFVINGHVSYQVGQSPYQQPAFVFKNISGERFDDVTSQAGPYFSIPHAGRGAAVGDLDNDGALDLVVSHQNEPVTLLRNRLTPQSWIRVKLTGTTSEPSAIGAAVSVTYQGRRLVQWTRSGAGYLSHFDSRILFPVEGEKQPDVTVRWPSGREETFRNLLIRQTNQLIEGKGESVSR